MYKVLRFLIAAGAALIFCGKSYALSVTEATDRVGVELLTSSENLVSGEPLEILIKFTPAPGWHILAENPGDIGIPTKVDWKLPETYRQGKVVWSIPEKFADEGIVQFGYENSAYYQTIIEVPQNIGDDDRFGVDISWQACREECVPEKIYLNFTLSRGDKIKVNPLWQTAEAEAAMSFVPGNGLQLPLILLMAFLGGIILNFMPCIFPILALKAITLAQTPYNRKKSRIESFFYFSGVLISFLSIATILIILRYQGEQIGWGFQLQSPVFVAIMIVVFGIIFLMLLDIVTIRNPLANKVGRISFKRQKIEAFMTGFFAVLIASPCTAPFMGIAIGYTLSRPIYVFYPVFLALSIGYALPFTLAGLFPRAIHRILPRPGRWMEILKKIFAIPVFLTVVWLVWVLCNQVEGQSFSEEQDVVWEVYEPEKVNELVRRGEPVFVNFTAKWCITCLANQKVALQSERFKQLVDKRRIHIFKADWTNHSDIITRALKTYGRNSIPLYVYYSGSENYVILPQLITPAILEDYLQ